MKGEWKSKGNGNQRKIKIKGFKKIRSLMHNLKRNKKDVLQNCLYKALILKEY